MGIDRLLTATRREVRAASRREALGGLRGYFGRQEEYLCYAERLGAGQSTGGGLVGGRASRRSAAA